MISRTAATIGARFVLEQWQEALPLPLAGTATATRSLQEDRLQVLLPNRDPFHFPPASAEAPPPHLHANPRGQQAEKLRAGLHALQAVGNMVCGGALDQ
jgi:hypothetical protein